MAEFSSKKRVKIEIQGLVQGVGFRPFVYRLAQNYKLYGYILNNGSGVTIEIQGDSEKILSFIEALSAHKPLLSRIDALQKEYLQTSNFSHFEIRNSTIEPTNTIISPDISLCKECLEELHDKNNRRYRYPFINCTNCGPRYTIINELPYDRDKTSMSNFDMCKLCAQEYNDPLNRRYHAQPISCFECGPQLKLLHKTQDTLTDTQEALNRAVFLIQNSKIIAIKGLGGFHIVCDASDKRALSTLRFKKNRPTKPLAVMFRDIAMIKKHCIMSKKDEALILSKERPIVIIKKRLDISLAQDIAPNIDKIGVFLPYTPLHELLMESLDFPIVATSANISDAPIIRDEKELFDSLDFIEYILSHDREILNACDDSVVQNVADTSIMLRMARGYAPLSFFIQKSIPKKILALGANQKSTVALAFDNHIVLSPHIGDLNSIEAVEYFNRTLETLQKVYNFKPDIIVCDKHPTYETTLWAKEYIKNAKNTQLIQLQHHYAHALSCMAEYSLQEDVLAFSFDGTGYGDDGKIWGGEVFLADTSSYKRIYYFEEFSLLGGQKAIKEPKRVALSLLFECFTLKEILALKHTLHNSFTTQEFQTLHQMYKRNINTPKTSSLGRLFDGVYALSGYMQDLAYEGESGLILETLSELSSADRAYSYSFKDGVIEYKEMIYEILQEKNASDIAKRFILSIAQIILDIVDEYTDLPVILSGGVFQNKVLLQELIKGLHVRNRRYYIQNKTPVNDGGISLGQAYYAIHKQG